VEYEDGGSAPRSVRTPVRHEEAGRRPACCVRKTWPLPRALARLTSRSGGALPAPVWIPGHGSRRARSDDSRIASAPARLCRTHRGASIFVDFDYEASGVCAAGEAFQTFRALRDDRVSVGPSLDHVTLGDLLVKERVETLPARA
jgi:hypothetical protein